MAQQKVARGFFAHIHPPLVTGYSLCFRSTYSLGTTLVALFLILAGTGMLLAFAYEPQFDGAYGSVWDITNVFPYGGLVRTVHYAAGNLFVVVCLLHLLRVVSAGAYLGARYRNYLYGLVLFFAAFASLATGYLLPMDEVAYWALVVGVSFLEYLPVVGKGAAFLVLGGGEVGDTTVARLYVLHLAGLPMLLLGFTALHLWRIRKDGGLWKPQDVAAHKLEKVPCAMVVSREQTVFLLVALLLLLWGLAYPLSLGSPAVPSVPPNPVKAAWFFIALQETLSYSVFWGGFAPLAGMALLFLVAPRLVEDAGGSAVPWRRRIFFSMTLATLLAYASFTLVGVFCRGPNWAFKNPFNINIVQKGVKA